MDWLWERLKGDLREKKSRRRVTVPSLELNANIWVPEFHGAEAGLTLDALSD